LGERVDTDSVRIGELRLRCPGGFDNVVVPVPIDDKFFPGVIIWEGVHTP
jgi:hypothetical protein